MPLGFAPAGGFALQSRLSTPRFFVFLGLLGASLLLGCVGFPTPLAPGLSGSVGLPHAGVLTKPAALPERGLGYRMFRNPSSARWGTSRLVATIQSSSQKVYKKWPGAPLLIGDLSNLHGGARNGHRSHRTGRDVDILLYCLTPDGRSIKSPGFVRFGADGLGETEDGTFVRFDTARNWELVRALVTSKDADVEWIFVARWLEALLIEYARSRGEDLDLLWRAENVMLQPGDSAAHDDHFHLRIACTPEETIAGCTSHGPSWPWLPPSPTLAEAAFSDEELIAMMLEDLSL